MEPRRAGRSVLLVQWSAMQKHGLFGHSFPLGSFVVFVTSSRLVTSFRYSTTRAQPVASDGLDARGGGCPTPAPRPAQNPKSQNLALRAAAQLLHPVLLLLDLLARLRDLGDFELPAHAVLGLEFLHGIHGVVDEPKPG